MKASRRDFCQKRPGLPHSQDEYVFHVSMEISFENSLPPASGNNELSSHRYTHTYNTYIYPYAEEVVFQKCG